MNSPEESGGQPQPEKKLSRRRMLRIGAGVSAIVGLGGVADLSGQPHTDPPDKSRPHGTQHRQKEDKRRVTAFLLALAGGASATALHILSKSEKNEQQKNLKQNPESTFSSERSSKNTG